MTRAEFVAAAYLKATGEVSALIPTDDDYQKLVAIGDMKIDEWAAEPDANWDVLYDRAYPIGTVTATDTFDIDDEIDHFSQDPDDYVKITHTDGQVSKYMIVAARQLKRYATGNYCAKVNRTLVFNKAFVATDPQFGGAITASVILKPEKLDADSTDVPVTNPQWLVTSAAYEWVRNDITLVQNAPALASEASALMTAMKSNQKPQFQEVSKDYIGAPTDW